MLYEYQCNCGNLFEQINTVKNRHNARCPKCQSVNVQKLISGTNELCLAGYLKDLNGEPIWFPKDGKPYFDRALRRTFNNPQEKKGWMDKRKIVMRGDTGPTAWKDGSGDMKNRSYRKENRWDD